MMKVRPNIMHRRVRERPDQVLVENRDKEYEAELDRAERRRQRRQVLVDERRKHLFATREEKAAIIHDMSETRQRLENARQAQIQAQVQYERNVIREEELHRTMSDEVDDMEQAARRAYLCNLCQENLKLAEYRRRMQWDASERDKGRERMAAEFYDRWGRNAFT